MLCIWPCLVVLVACTSLRGAVSCGGRDVQKIAAVLEEVWDWETLAAWLDIRIATINNINKNCPPFEHTQCRWRQLIRKYCDGNGGGDPYKTAADIADILDSKMGNKRLAQKLNRLVFTKGGPDEDHEGYCTAQTRSRAMQVRPLSTKDLGTVLKEIKDVNKKWKFLGLELGLLGPTLDGISGSNYEEYKMEMIQKWLNNPDYKPSWNSLVDALRSDLVEHKPIADEIERKYLC